MQNSDRVAVVERYVEAFATQDLDIIKDIFAPDARVEDPVGAPPHQGLEAVTEFYRGALAMGAKLKLTGKPRCAGNAVAFPFKIQLPEMTIHVIDVFEFDEQGKVASMRAYWGPDNITK